MPTETLVIDSTMISTFRACEEKYRLRMKELYVPKSDSGAAAAGIVFHEAAAAFRKLTKARAEGANSLSLAQRTEAALEVLAAEYASKMPPEFTSGACPDERRSLANLQRIFQGWAAYEESQQFTYLYIEQSGGISLGTIERASRTVDVVYSVIIDSVVQKQGCIFANDLKTTSSPLSSSWQLSFRLSQQIMGYVIACEQLLGVPVYGALVSGVWLQKEPKSSRGKPLDEYFCTVPLTYTPAQLEEWHSNTLLTVNRILECEEAGTWQLNFGDSCRSYNGCVFKEVCWSAPQARPQLLKMSFERATWTPLEEIRSRKVEVEG